MKKRCSKCEKKKKRKKFNLNSNSADSLTSICKKCEYLRWRTKEGLVSRLFANQKHHSTTRGHKAPTYTKADFREWLFSQKLFHKLYDNWKRLDYQKGYAPSVDRKDDLLGYTMGNIKLMTFNENCKKSHSDRKLGIGSSGKVCKKVIQKTANGVMVGNFHSASEASRVTGISQSSISYACRGEREFAGKFIWEYLDA